MRGKTGKRARSATTGRHTRRMKRKGTERKIKSADTFPYSPISSPGSPQSPVSFDSPITHRAKELARLYPNKKMMVRRSKSFDSVAMSREEFYSELEKLLGFENVRYSPKG
jgi:hypothetical protein